MAKGLVLMLKEEGVKGYFEATLEALNKLSDKEELDEKFIYDSKLRAVMANANAYIDTLESVKPEILDKSRTIKSNALMIYAILNLDLNLESILPLPKDAKKDLQTIYKKLHASFYKYMQANQMTNIEELETDDKIQDFVRIIEKVTATFGEKPSGDDKIPSKKRKPAFLSPKQIKENNYYKVPISTTTIVATEMLQGKDKMNELPIRKKQVSHNAKYKVLKQENQRRLEYESEKVKITFELENVEKILGAKNPARKFFIMALVKANEQIIHEGTFSKYCVTFPLQELVDCRLYKNKDSARKGFKTAMSALTSLKYQGEETINKKKKITNSTLRVLFTGADIKNGQCSIHFNNLIDWDFSTQYFSILPKYYLDLSDRAFDLLTYIFYMARQKCEDISKKEYFNISFRSIQHKLFLPFEGDTEHPQRDIKDEMEKAISEIEDKQFLYYGANNPQKEEPPELSFLPVYNENASIEEYLDKGYLKVELRGELAKYFKDIYEESEKQRRKALNRKKQIEEKARIKNLAEKMKNEEKSGE